MEGHRNPRSWDMKSWKSAFIAMSLSLAALAQSAKAPQKIDVSKEKMGAEPTVFLPMVGNWTIVEDDGKKVVLVDGRMWEKGQPAGGLAEKARAIYGSKHEEFLDNIKAFAYYPYAVAR